jgi:glycosyltransferase involved in cell wall biosynthesis
MRIIYLPLENIEQRYSKMMNEALNPLCDIVLYPDFDFSEMIEKGQFLDINKTSIFKARQLEMVAKMFYKNEIKNGDCFLIADIFYPGIESIRYMAELQGIKVFMAGFNYAGRADKTDFVRKLKNWSDFSEKGYHECMDLLFVGSQFHKKQIEDYFYQGITQDWIKVTGYIWDTSYIDKMKIEIKPKESFVIWPHRICNEKGYDELLDLARNTDLKIVVTSSGNDSMFLPKHSNIEYKFNLTKKEYYETLSRAEYYLSTAYQETFGYTLQEAIYFGCKISVPNRACYPEMVPKSSLFHNIEGLDKFIKESKVIDKSYTWQWDDNANQIISFVLNLK